MRSGDLFSNKDWMAKATSALGGLKGVSNIYTQHQPLLVKTLERISKPNKQLNEEFPYISSPSRKK